MSKDAYCNAILNVEKWLQEKIKEEKKIKSTKSDLKVGIYITVLEKIDDECKMVNTDGW